jgi:hypothetical protein
MPVETGVPAPRELTAEELARARQADGRAGDRPVPQPETAPDTAPAPVSATAPVLHPPGTPAADAESDPGLVTARVLALFGSDPGNSWIHLDGIGWRRLAGGATAEATLGGLAAAARIQATPVLVRLDADDRVSEVYLW